MDNKFAMAALKAFKMDLLVEFTGLFRPCPVVANFDNWARPTLVSALSITAMDNSFDMAALHALKVDFFMMYWFLLAVSSC